MIAPRTLKGFRDFLPQQQRRRMYVIQTLMNVFTLFGFEPLETPALEYEDILTGKYGEEGDRLMYRFLDHGKRNVAMRYDQTVPLARVVAQYQNELPFPFKRYQIQNVWRAENTQKGRYREFTQCDIDVVGSNSPLSDVEILLVCIKSLGRLGFKQYKLLFNDRKVFSDLVTNEKITKSEMDVSVVAIDKLKKIGKDGVINELVRKGIHLTRAKDIIELILRQEKTDVLHEMNRYIDDIPELENKCVFDPTLVRGLSYYTGLIFEVEIDGIKGSVCGGGRYDNLIGMFSSKSIPAIGFSFGFDRLIEAMRELSLFPDYIDESASKVLVSIFSTELEPESLKIAQTLLNNDIPTEVYLGEIKPKNALEKQLKYADLKHIPLIVILGPTEYKEKNVTIKNLKTHTQKTIPLDNLIQEVKGL